MYKRMLMIGMMFLVFSCSKNSMISRVEEILEIDARLAQDLNGYYHMLLDRRDQTFHRLSAQTGNFGQTYTMPKVSWFSYDSEGNEKIWTFTDEFGHEHKIPIINGSSYPDMDGIVNQMLAPVVSMIGDTVTIIVVYDSMITGDRYIDEVDIILD